MTYNDLMAKAAHGPFSHTTNHPGTDSATGCGSNSNYYVTWHMVHTGQAPVKVTAHPVGVETGVLQK